MMHIRYVQSIDWLVWHSLDPHLSQQEFIAKVVLKRGYVLLEDSKVVGMMRFNLFWDNTPFCTMLFIDEQMRRKGCGRMLMAHWEQDMKSRGYGMLLTSTQVDETAQHFYRKLGYKDCGGLLVDVPGYAQPMELFLVKALS